MERLFNFLYEYRAFFTFLLLEFLCAWLLIVNNQYQNTKYFNTSNSVVASINSTEEAIRSYFSLRDVNAVLSKENSTLRNQLEQRNQMLYSYKLNQTDSTLRKQYVYVNSKVVNNTTKYYKNYITIDRGADSGIEPGMAVISEAGVVGKVKTVSEHYAVVISLLNIDEQVSCVLKRTGHFGTVQWEGTSSSLTSLKYIPRHVRPMVGDSIVTSEYNAIFPPGIFIGKIKEYNLRSEAPFYEIKVELGQDFGKLSFVEVVKNQLKKEKEALERSTFGESR
ncbi:MAG TPA: rod shape-determining protein MreC [Cyclobacteriaceae bacterium]|jgi:rod shape-determining protein MreC|nr:rod shape-determining protein MreC [Cyclobacteriaceae bacterium]